MLKAFFVKVSQNFIKPHLKFCLISQISAQSLWHKSLFSSKDKSKKLKCRLLQFLFGALTHFILIDSSTVICWTSPFVILGVLGLFCLFHSIFSWKIVLANTVDPEQMHVMWPLIWVCTVCIPILVAIAAHTRLCASIRPHCVCSVLRVHAQFCQFDKVDATADVQ